MDVSKIVSELRAERDGLTAAIMALERLVHNQGPRRGRPPAWLKNIEAIQNQPKRRGRPPGSKNQRRRVVKTNQEAAA